MPMYNLTEYSSNYFETTGSLWIYSEDEVTNFNANITNTDNLKSFKYKAILFRNIDAQNDNNAANGILKNATIAVPLKYLSNFWRSLEMPLVNCKAELKLSRTKHCVLSVAGTDNANGNNDNIIFTIKETKLYVPVVTYQQKTIKNYQIFWVKDLKDQFIGMSIKQKVRIKIQQMNKDIFFNQTLLESMNYLFYLIQMRLAMLKDLMIENIIYQKAKKIDADPKTIQQIEFVGQLKKLDDNDNYTDDGNGKSVFVLTILEKIKETQLKFSQGIVTVLKKW